MLFVVARTGRMARKGIRYHMSHGSPSADFLSAVPTKSGPREPLELGLDATRASQNILRLLESSHGVGSQCADTLSTVWNPQGLIWHHDQNNGWTASTIGVPPRSSTEAPRLLSLDFSDDRTALAKVQGIDGLYRLVSLLRLDSSKPGPSPNDGWQLIREVIGAPTKTNHTAITSIANLLEQYLSIEHGGGAEDARIAQALFAPQASLLTVGTLPLDEPPTDWSAPSGSLLSIDIQTYLQGVASQTPHSLEAKAHDSIVQVNVLPCQTAAAAIVHVGNGAQTNVFVDHLLLGNNNGDWKILSKTFATRKWPQ